MTAYHATPNWHPAVGMLSACETMSSCNLSASSILCLRPRFEKIPEYCDKENGPNVVLVQASGQAVLSASDKHAELSVSRRHVSMIRMTLTGAFYAPYSGNHYVDLSLPAGAAESWLHLRRVALWLIQAQRIVSYMRFKQFLPEECENSDRHRCYCIAGQSY